MPVSSRWYDEHQTILIQTYRGQVDLSSMKQAITDNLIWCARVPHTVHIITDSRGCTLDWVSLISPTYVGHLVKNQTPPNLGYGALLTDGTGAVYQYSLHLLDLARLLHSPLWKRTGMVTTLEQALQYVQEQARDDPLGIVLKV